MKKDKLGFIYFIQQGCNGDIKIGFSKNVSKRIKQLQTGNPCELKLIYVLENSTMDVEKSLHKYFGNETNTRLEWYERNAVLNWIAHDKLQKQVLREEGLIK